MVIGDGTHHFTWSCFSRIVIFIIIILTISTWLTNCIWGWCWHLITRESSCRLVIREAKMPNTPTVSIVIIIFDTFIENDILENFKRGLRITNYVFWRCVALESCSPPAPTCQLLICGIKGIISRHCKTSSTSNRQMATTWVVRFMAVGELDYNLSCFSTKRVKINLNGVFNIMCLLWT